MAAPQRILTQTTIPPPASVLRSPSTAARLGASGGGQRRPLIWMHHGVQLRMLGEVGAEE